MLCISYLQSTDSTGKAAKSVKKAPLEDDGASSFKKVDICK